MYMNSLTNKKPKRLGTLLGKMEDNDHIKLENIEIEMYLSLCESCFRDTSFLIIRNTPNDPQNYLKHLTSQASCTH